MWKNQEWKLRITTLVTSNPIVHEVSSDSADLNQSCEVSNEEVDHHVSQEARPLYDKLKLYLI